MVGGIFWVITIKMVKKFEDLKKERIKDNRKREKDKKILRFFNKIILTETILGLLIALIIYIFFIKN